MLGLWPLIQLCDWSLKDSSALKHELLSSLKSLNVVRSCLHTPLPLQTLGLPQLGSKLPVQQPPAAEENQKVLTVAQL